MEIRTDVTLAFPRERVFATYRDRLEELRVYLPNIRALRVKSREVRGAEVDLVNEWTGGGEIPAVARSFLSESMLRWTDHATWVEASFVCDWRTVVHAFPGALLCSGQNRFVEASGKTRIEFRGQLTCDASKVPGVPRLLARSINGTVEKLFVGKIGENLVAVGEGVGKLLASEAG
jgi:hypothetical protein